MKNIKKLILSALLFVCINTYATTAPAPTASGTYTCTNVDWSSQPAQASCSNETCESDNSAQYIQAVCSNGPEGEGESNTLYLYNNNDSDDNCLSSNPINNCNGKLTCGDC